MPITRRQFGLAAAGGSALALLGTRFAVADEFPEKGRTLRLVIPFPPGGITDVLSRRIGTGLSSALGTEVIPDNRDGASGVTAINSMKGAPADGYTLFVGYISSHATNVSLIKDLSYDPVADFTPIGLMADAPAIILTYPGLPVNNASELVAYARENPGKLKFASVGNGSPAHIVIELLKRDEKLDIVHVPYRGTAQLLPDIMSGVVHAYLGVASTAAPAIAAGQVKAISVLADERLPQLPEVSTARETGVDLMLSTWFGLWAHGKIPAPAQERLVGALKQTLEDASFEEWALKQGLRILGGSPEELERFAAAETARFAELFKAANIQKQ